MTAFSHETPSARAARPAWLELPEFWAAVSIVVMWLAVLFDGVYGPSIVTHNGVADVGTATSVPSVVVVAPCAVVATWLVARHAFRRQHD
ncbi:MAG TPA: hypothetical protein VFA37_03680 [Gaiellaceae bacterium]|nr:hypothetical protein [Gaiellaceae bacterium]